MKTRGLVACSTGKVPICKITCNHKLCDYSRVANKEYHGRNDSPLVNMDQTHYAIPPRYIWMAWLHEATAVFGSYSHDTHTCITAGHNERAYTFGIGKTTESLYGKNHQHDIGDWGVFGDILNFLDVMWSRAGMGGYHRAERWAEGPRHRLLSLLPHCNQSSEHNSRYWIQSNMAMYLWLVEGSSTCTGTR